MQQTSNWQTHSLYLHILLLLFILFIIYGLTTIKTQTINNQQLDVILGNQDSCSHALTPVEKVLCHFLWVPLLLLFILFIIYGLTTIKTQTINNQQLDAILGNQDSYSHALTPVEKVPCHFLWVQGPMNVRRKN